MTRRLPDLEDGRVYRVEEVTSYIGDQSGSPDSNVVMARFPRNLSDFAEFDDEEWLDEELFLQYRVLPMDALRDSIRQVANRWAGRSDHEAIECYFDNGTTLV